MNAEQKARISDAVEAQHPYPEGDSEGAHAFALDADAPQYEAVAVVSAPTSLADRMEAVEREVKTLVVGLAAASSAIVALSQLLREQRATTAITAITPTDPWRDEKRERLAADARELRAYEPNPELKPPVFGGGSGL